jgi:hypothetical protein
MPFFRHENYSKEGAKNPSKRQKRVLKVKIKLALEQVTKAQRGSRGIALPFL